MDGSDHERARRRETLATDDLQPPIGAGQQPRSDMNQAIHHTGDHRSNPTIASTTSSMAHRADPDGCDRTQSTQVLAPPVIVEAKLAVDETLDQMLDGATFEPADDRSGTAPESAMEQAEQIRLVQQALLRVSEEFRQPLVLKEIDGMSYEEIAVELEAPLGTVKAQLHRARELMFEMVKNKRDHI